MKTENEHTNPSGCVFESEYLMMPYTPTKEEVGLRELAQEYHRTCENYDRRTCTGPIKDGAIMPANGEEMMAINRHAKTVRDVLGRRVTLLGFTFRQWTKAIREESFRYKHNAEVEHE